MAKSKKSKAEKSQQFTRRDFLKVSGAALFSTVFLNSIAACSGQTSTTTEVATTTATATVTATGTVTSTGTVTVAPELKTIKDMLGNTVMVPVDARRVAFPWANQYEIMMMAGATDRIVAIHPNVKLFPWLVKYTPEIVDVCAPFSGVDVNIEELLSVNPDLVFALETSTGVIDKCRIAGLPVAIILRPRTIDIIRNNVAFVGEVLGGEANTLVQRYDSYLDEKLKTLESVISKLSDSQRPTVVTIITDNALQVPGESTIQDEWISVAGGINVAKGFTGNMVVNAEQLLTWDPDVIIPPSNKTKTMLMTDSRFKDLSAVKNDRVYINPHGFFDWQYTAPTIALQIQWAAQTLHPDLFPDIDMREEVKNYHETLLGQALTDEDAEEILFPEVYDATPAPQTL